MILAHESVIGYVAELVPERISLRPIFIGQRPTMSSDEHSLCLRDTAHVWPGSEGAAPIAAGGETTRGPENGTLGSAVQILVNSGVADAGGRIDSGIVARARLD